MRTQDISYHHGDVSLRGFLACDETASGPRPGVVLVHEGLGLNDFALERTRMLAKLGYVAMASDMFGDRRQAGSLEDSRALIRDLQNDPPKLRARAGAALATLAALPLVDRERLAAVGFCFGGFVALELARAGADLKAVVCFHGALKTKNAGHGRRDQSQCAGVYWGR